MQPPRIEEDIILQGDDRSATYRKDIEGWVSRNGKFYGTDEQLARLAGATHRECIKCNAVFSDITRTMCLSCVQKAVDERYSKRATDEWDGKVPLYSETLDVYFFDESEIIDVAEEHPDTDLQLRICEPVYIPELDPNEFWADYGPEGEGYEMSVEMSNAVDTLNTVIKQQPPAHWFPGPVATTYEVNV